MVLLDPVLLTKNDHYETKTIHNLNTTLQTKEERKNP